MVPPGVARVLVVLLVLAFPLGMLPRVLLGDSPDTPLPRRPAWSDVIVVSVGGWSGSPGPATPSLAAFERRADRVAAVAPSDDRAHAAVGLWTARYPGSLGLRAPDDSLTSAPVAPWTLAEAAARTGARTGAFLQEPWITTTGLGGFGTVVEAAAPSSLVDLAVSFVEDHPGERLVLWLHLDLGADGAGPADLEEAFARLDAALADTDRLASAARVLCRLDATADRPDAPLLVSLPGALYPGRRAAGRVSLVDVAAMLRVLLKLPPPRQAAPPIQGRVDLLWNALRGGDTPAWAVMQRDAEDVWFLGSDRVRRALGDEGDELFAESWDGTAWVPVDAGRRDLVLGQARAALATLD